MVLRHPLEKGEDNQQESGLICQHCPPERTMRPLEINCSEKKRRSDVFSTGSIVYLLSIRCMAHAPKVSLVIQDLDFFYLT